MGGLAKVRGVQHDTRQAPAGSYRLLATALPSLLLRDRDCPIGHTHVPPGAAFEDKGPERDHCLGSVLGMGDTS